MANKNVEVTIFVIEVGAATAEIKVYKHRFNSDDEDLRDDLEGSDYELDDIERAAKNCLQDIDMQQLNQNERIYLTEIEFKALQNIAKWKIVEV